VLPGNGLAQHDFFYAGEGKQERMCIVRDGKIIWSYEHPASGEISDATLFSGGNVLFAHQHGVTEINTDKQVVWNFNAPSNTEIHTAQRVGPDNVLFIENGNPAKLVVFNTTSNTIDLTFDLPVGNPKSTHGQFRHARLTDAGTLLVAQMDLDKVCEYDSSGKVVWAVVVPGPWSATPLKNGNILVCTSKKSVLEINRDGETVWQFTAADAPGYQFSSIQLATRLANGNTLINNWFNQWSSRLDPNNLPVQAIEVTPDKKIVWALRSWEPPADLGPSTTIQVLDEPVTPEDYHFGDIH
jgi:outer membrane protein assembly factor BamB